ncbi:helix-turn-helix transcriptional regulator [Elizabethkingia anophelis]|nr:helix-turn-helix transcriptional regulator [Elizabethkingia anophelis]MCT3822522.1 helix-turn-helix transcriptional regulator [Elizabethkingia anophelis]MCT3929840.1 helix-turn-helix transcriptional regulator [Elizabethkingia anophelis]MCT4075999.1 helix-turn-helix transcriptional regulator [Elizabethkingia anophelis]MCT4079667.1 helix-turn-helix transcriptional regulator [Elizabethkingia anophelis]
MITKIIKPNHSELKDIIQYFIIFKSEDNSSADYTTFPNTNLCLSIYRQNKIVIEQDKGSKHLFTFESIQMYKSYLLGFHESSLKVSVNTNIDGICIIFHPSALRWFSNISYEELTKSDEAFQMLFPRYNDCFLEQLFEENNNMKRIIMLENLFLKSITKEYLTDRIREILCTVSKITDLKVSNVAKELSINESTLYRLFINQIGQNPNTFFRTIRFRNALNEILRFEKTKLTSVAYQNHYTDQSHFIRDIKNITGQTPGELKNKTSIQQEELVWIYSQH